MIDLLLRILLQILLQLSLVLLSKTVILPFILITRSTYSRMQCLILDLDLWLVNALN